MADINPNAKGPLLSTASVENQSENRHVHMLQTKQATINQMFEELHEAVKHHKYEDIAKLSASTTKQVMQYITLFREYFEECKTIAGSNQKALGMLNGDLGYLTKMLDEIKALKKLSKIYKSNETFNHNAELRQIIEDEDIRMVELEQAVNATLMLCQS